MKDLAIRKKMKGSLSQAIEKVTEAIKPAGFGVLTRIDLDQKLKEKLNEDIPKTVILGACNPRVAFEAHKQSTDVALLIPCNIVVREIGPDEIAVEAIRPTAMLSFLPNVKAESEILQVEKNLEVALSKL